MLHVTAPVRESRYASQSGDHSHWRRLRFKTMENCGQRLATHCAWRKLVWSSHDSNAALLLEHAALPRQPTLLFTRLKQWS